MRLGIIIVAGIIFTSCNFASAQATQPGPTRIKLWQTAPGIVAGVDNDTDPTEPTMDIYLPAGATSPTAAFVVLPGGGYVHLSTIREGSDIDLKAMAALQNQQIIEQNKIRLEQNDKKISDMSRRTAVLEAKLALVQEQKKKIESAISASKAKGGLTPETLAQIEEASGLL